MVVITLDGVLDLYSKEHH